MLKRTKKIVFAILVVMLGVVMFAGCANKPHEYVAYKLDESGYTCEFIAQDNYGSNYKVYGYFAEVDDFAEVTAIDTMYREVFYGDKIRVTRCRYIDGSTEYHYHPSKFKVVYKKYNYTTYEYEEKEVWYRVKLKKIK